MRRNKGSFLLEAALACGILAVGLVAVMQSFAMQRRAVTGNVYQTGVLIALQSCVGAVYAGVRPDQLEYSGGRIDRARKEAPLGISGLQQIEFRPASGAEPKNVPALRAYVRQTVDRSAE